MDELLWEKAEQVKGSHAWVELQNSIILTANNPIEKRLKTQWAFQKASAIGSFERTRMENVQTLTV